MGWKTTLGDYVTAGTEPRGKYSQCLAAEKDHLPNLDGLRTLAAFTVVLGHCHAVSAFPIHADSSLQWLKRLLFEQAALGVQFFFVLSGFLITRIVLREQGQEKGFDIRLFWLRRVLRIWPVYFLVAALGGLAAATGWTDFAMPNNQWPLILTFLENFDLLHLIQQGLPYGRIVSVLWSVSIEEQFYLVYPLLLILVPRRLYPPVFLAILAAALRFKLVHISGPAIGFHTFSQVYELGIGCFLGALFPNRPRWCNTVPRLVLLMPYLFCLLQIVQPQWPTIPFSLPWLFGLVVLDQAYCEQSWLQSRRIPLINSLGKLTYGIYCYHMIFVLAVFNLMKLLGVLPHTIPTFALFVGSVGLLTVSFSLASYRWLESPCLKLKNRLRPQIWSEQRRSQE